MADVVVIGGGLGGLSTGMLLARDGHRVTVLERDPAPPPGAPEEAWERWERRGVNQFRMLHFMLPRWRQLMEQELPEVLEQMDARGAIRYNFITEAPDEVTGGPREGDERFATVTARRPVIESAVAAASQTFPGLTVRRGVAVDALLTGAETAPGIPHVVGVRTEDGEELRADLVVDTTGRRSPLPRWLEAIGARRPQEELEDCGFVYYGRHFRSADGSTPPALGPLLQPYGTLSILTLPADNGTWGVGIIASAKDAPMRSVREVARWEAVVGSHPLVAHWADGAPIDEGVAVMAKIEDRWRRYATEDGTPVATGVVAVGDSWACTNPSLGRGTSIGMLHAVALRDLVRSQPLDEPMAFVTAFDTVTVEQIEPWYRATLWFDRHRLAEIESLLDGREYDTDDPTWAINKALDASVTMDGDILRAFGDIVGLTASTDEVFSRPGLLDKVLTLGAGWRDAPVLGPDRGQLLATIGG